MNISNLFLRWTMIGIYDSGVGGLATWKYFKTLLPSYSYTVLADTAMFPLGEKNPDEIKNNTYKALHWFFDQGAKLVIIACNTAAAYAVRSWQKEFPRKKVLSITVPGVEELIAHFQHNTLENDIGVGVLATKSTVFSGIYNDLFTRLGGDTVPNFEFVISSELISAIEDNSDSKKTEELVRQYCKKFTTTPDILVLGCTHFSLVKHLFEKYFDGIVIDPSHIAAVKLHKYLLCHPEIENKITKSESTNFFITKSKTYNMDLVENIKFQKIDI